MFRFLHVADVHLGAPFGGFGREASARGREVLDAFRSLPDLADRLQAEAVVIAGDLFDGPRPTESTVIAVREVVRRFVDRSIPVFAVPGNHDARALNPELYATALEGAVVFSEPRFTEPARTHRGDDEIFVYGFAYDAAEERDPFSSFERASADGLHVALLHGSVPGAPHWDSGSSLSFSWEALAGLDVDYVALGDLHRFRETDELNGIPACYPGSFAAVDFSERGLRGPVLVELSPGGPVRIERCSSGVREVSEAVVIDVSPCMNDLEVAELASSQLESAYPVVTLEGEPAFPLDAGVVKGVLEERYGAATLVDRSRFFDAGRLEEIARRSTVAGHVARLGLAKIEAAETPEDRHAAEQGLRIALRVMEVS